VPVRQRSSITLRHELCERPPRSRIAEPTAR
jgi:hypothetical protein